MLWIINFKYIVKYVKRTLNLSSTKKQALVFHAKGPAPVKIIESMTHQFSLSTYFQAKSSSSVLAGATLKLESKAGSGSVCCYKNSTVSPETAKQEKESIKRSENR